MHLEDRLVQQIDVLRLLIEEFIRLVGLQSVCMMQLCNISADPPGGAVPTEYSIRFP